MRLQTYYEEETGLELVILLPFQCVFAFEKGSCKSRAHCVSQVVLELTEALFLQSPGAGIAAITPVEDDLEPFILLLGPKW